MVRYGTETWHESGRAVRHACLHSIKVIRISVGVSIHGALNGLIGLRHVWDTVDLFYPRALSRLIRHTWDTVDLFYPRTLSHLIRHVWDTVDLSYPWALIRPIQHVWDTVDLFYPRGH